MFVTSCPGLAARNVVDESDPVNEVYARISDIVKEVCAHKLFLWLVVIDRLTTHFK